MKDECADCMARYLLASREFERSCLPGGAIHGKLAEIKRLADLIEQKRADLIEQKRGEA